MMTQYSKVKYVSSWNPFKSIDLLAILGKNLNRTLL